MKRRDFLKQSGAGLSALAVAPIALAAMPSEKGGLQMLMEATPWQSRESYIVDASQGVITFSKPADSALFVFNGQKWELFDSKRSHQTFGTGRQRL